MRWWIDRDFNVHTVIAILLAAGCAASCTIGDVNATAVEEASSKRMQTTFDFPAGESTQSDAFDAPDPRNHTINVTVEYEPADATLDIWLDPLWAEDSPPQSLRIINRQDSADNCERQDAATLCELSIPALEGPRAGPWKLYIHKSSEDPAQVLVAIRFDPI